MTIICVIAGFPCSVLLIYLILVDGCWWQYTADVAGNEEIIMPVPAFVAINGGSHGGKKLAIQACCDCKLPP